MLLAFLIFFVLSVLIPVSSSIGIERTIYCKTSTLDTLTVLKSNLDFNGFDTYIRIIFHNGTHKPNNADKARETFFKSTYLSDYLGKSFDAEKTEFLKSYATQIYLHLFRPGRCILDPAYGNFVNFLFDKENAVRLEVCTVLDAEDTKSTNKQKYNKCVDNGISPDIFKYYIDRIDSNNSAKKSMKVFDFLDDDTVETIKNDIRDLPKFEIQTTTATSFDVPLWEELMTSNLLMNNYGRVVRELKTRRDLFCKHNMADASDAFKKRYLTFVVQCDDENFGDTQPKLFKNEIEFCVSIENFYTFVRCFFIAVSVLVNFYMLLTLEASDKNMEIISVSLIRLLFISNVIFLITDVWFIVESFYPIIPPGTNYHFVEVSSASVEGSKFDGELWKDVTYFISMESVRMTMDFRVEALDFNMTHHSSRGVAIRTLLVVQNTLLNISRTYAGSINFCVMFFVLYDLRRSYHGVIKSIVLLWFKVILGTMFVLITVSYIAAGVLQFIVLTKVNDHVKNSIVSPKDTDHAKSKPDKLEGYKHFLHFHTYLMLLFYLLTSIIIIVVLTYYKIKQIVYPVNSKNVMLEMSHTMKSLFLASAVYIISNFIVTVTEIRFLLNSKMGMANIAVATYQYHWLYLFVYADIIIHPIILIHRLASMRATHLYFWDKFNQFNFGVWLGDIILHLHHRFYPKAETSNGIIRAQFRPSERPKKPTIYSDDSVDTLRHRTRRPTDSELQDMLKILEMQRNEHLAVYMEDEKESHPNSA